MVGAPLLAGIDAGTSRVRALIFTTTGRLVAEGSRPTPLVRPRPGWAEQDAESLWQAAAGALRDATSRLDRAQDVVGIAVASVGEAFVPLDAAGDPTGPVIAWYDERPTPQLQAIETTIGRDRLHRLTGLSADPTFTLCKLLWLKANTPDVLDRSVRWLNLCHYLAWRLCGVPTTDLSQASRTLALDLERHRFADDLVREVGLDPGCFPEIRPAGTRLGQVTAEAADATGLDRHCTVGVAGHDHIVGALAAGALEPGVLLNSLGSAEALTLALPGPNADPETGRRGFNQGVVQVDRPIHYVFGGFHTSGASIEWFRSLFARALDPEDPTTITEIGHAELIAAASAVPPGAGGVTFVPDLRGRVSPAPDPIARGAWFGLRADASRAALYRAVLEGMAFEARLTVDTLMELPGFRPIERIRAIGGNTQNDLLLAIKASVYDRAIVAAAMPEATALGAALLGGLAAGVFRDLGEARAGIPETTRTITPVVAWQATYERQYRDVYRPAYAALKPLHHAIAALAPAPAPKDR